jgi:SSS family solute:Na+ symporter
MSSVDSYLNASATIVTFDFYKRFFNPEASDTKILNVGRIATAALLVFAILFAFMIAKIEGMGIYAIFQTLMAFFQGPALALILTGLLWKRANGKGALVGFIGGVCFSITLYALSQESVYTALGLQPLFKVPDPFLFYSIWAFVVALSLIIIVSLATPPESDEKLKDVVWRFKKTKET